MLAGILILLWLTGCGSPSAQQQTDDDSSYIFTMGTVFEIRVFSQDAREIIQKAEQALYACEDLISWRQEGSLVDTFNTAHEGDMSEIGGLMETAMRICADSRGAFDLTVLPLSTLWDFDRLGESDFDQSQMTVPAASDIEAAREKVDYTKLTYDASTGRLTAADDSVQIELGAIGKGYAIDRAMEVLAASDASGGMISAGSSICVYGTKNDGSLFRVALRDPRGDENSSAIAVLNVTDTTISTSGDYERYFEKDGVRYHHILDPRTGYPADSGLMQVSIICDNSTLGDALSTACFVLGLDEGMALAGQYGVQAIFVDTDRNIWYNDENVLDMLEFLGEDAGYTLHLYNQEQPGTVND